MRYQIIIQLSLIDVFEWSIRMNYRIIFPDTFLIASLLLSLSLLLLRLFWRLWLFLRLLSILFRFLERTIWLFVRSCKFFSVDCTAYFTMNRQFHNLILVLIIFIFINFLCVFVWRYFCLFLMIRLVLFNIINLLNFVMDWLRFVPAKVYRIIFRISLEILHLLKVIYNGKLVSLSLWSFLRHFYWVYSDCINRFLFLHVYFVFLNWHVNAHSFEILRIQSRRRVNWCLWISNERVRKSTIFLSFLARLLLEINRSLFDLWFRLFDDFILNLFLDVNLVLKLIQIFLVI